MKIQVSVLTVSDRCSQGVTEDASGRTLKDLISTHDQLSLCRYAIVPDDGDRVKVSLAHAAGDSCVRRQSTLREWSDAGGSDVILTTGGTGFSHRDVTPEGT